MQGPNATMAKAELGLLGRVQPVSFIGGEVLLLHDVMEEQVDRYVGPMPHYSLTETGLCS